jgi:hypothetical protein
MTDYTETYKMAAFVALEMQAALGASDDEDSARKWLAEVLGAPERWAFETAVFVAICDGGRYNYHQAARVVLALLDKETA